VLTLKAFGGLDFRDEACASIPELLAQPKRSALLAYLVLAHRGSFCRRDTLLALFWPELDDQAGRRALTQALSFLRRHLPDGVLTTRGTEEVGVDAVRVRSDVDTFRRALAAEEWGDAVAHYHGELLDGLHVAGAAPFTDWVDRERERLREAAAAAAWQDAHGLIARGYLVEAERAGQVALRLVPTDESAVRTFIEVLAGAGDRAAALQFYEKFAGVLAQELDVEPAWETRAVAERIRNGEVAVNLRTPPPGVITPLPFPPVTGAKGPEDVADEDGAPSPPTPPTATTSAAAPQAHPGVLPGLFGIPRRVAAGMGAVALAVLAGAGAWELLWNSPLATVTDIRPVTVEQGVEFLPALSPDGRDVAFVSGGQIVVRSVGHVPGQGEVRLGDPPPSRAVMPSWTPDGSLVRFMACAGKNPCRWVAAPRTGGAPVSMEFPAGVPAGARELAWSHDAVRIAFFRGDTLFVTDGRGAPRPILAFDPGRRRYGDLHSLAWSPDGERIAFVNGASHFAWVLDTDPSSLWVVDSNGANPMEIVGGDATQGSPTWLDDDNLLFVSNRDGPSALYVVRVGRRGTRGEPRLVPGITDPHTISYSPSTGRLAFSRFSNDRSIRSYPLDPSEPTSLGDGEPVTSGRELTWLHDVSQDGRWLAYESHLDGQSDLYKMELPDGRPVRLTDSPRDEISARWSPDGREIAFCAQPPPSSPGEWQVFVMSADGGTPTQVTHSAPGQGWYTWPTWSPDGLTLAVSADGGAPGWQGGMLIARDSVGAPWKDPVRFVTGQYGYGVWAADGQSVLVNPYGIGTVIHQTSVRGDTLWSRDMAATSDLSYFGNTMVLRAAPGSRTLYSRGIHKDGTLGIWAVDDWGRGTPRLIVRFDDPFVDSNFISVGPDRLYLTVQRDESDVWVAQLRR